MPNECETDIRAWLERYRSWFTAQNSEPCSACGWHWNVAPLNQVVPDELIGLWRFRVRGEEPLWAATYCVSGHYFDVEACQSPEEAIELVRQGVEQAKNETPPAASEGPS